MLFRSVKVTLTFGTALALGFQNNGSLMLAMGIVLLLAVAAIGLGLVVSCFSRNDGEATNLAEFLAAAQMVDGDIVYDLNNDGINVLTIETTGIKKLTVDDFDFV